MEISKRIEKLPVTVHKVKPILHKQIFHKTYRTTKLVILIKKVGKLKLILSENLFQKAFAWIPEFLNFY